MTKQDSTNPLADLSPIINEIYSRGLATYQSTNASPEQPYHSWTFKYAHDSEHRDEKIASQSLYSKSPAAAQTLVTVVQLESNPNDSPLPHIQDLYSDVINKKVLEKVGAELMGDYLTCETERFVSRIRTASHYPFYHSAQHFLGQNNLEEEIHAAFLSELVGCCFQQLLKHSFKEKASGVADGALIEVDCDVEGNPYIDLKVTHQLAIQSVAASVSHLYPRFIKNLLCNGSPMTKAPVGLSSGFMPIEIAPSKTEILGAITGPDGEVSYSKIIVMRKQTPVDNPDSLTVQEILDEQGFDVRFTDTADKVPQDCDVQWTYLPSPTYAHSLSETLMNNLPHFLGNQSGSYAVQTLLQALTAGVGEPDTYVKNGMVGSNWFENDPFNSKDYRDIPEPDSAKN